MVQTDSISNLFICIFLRGDEIHSNCFVLWMNLNNLTELCDKVNKMGVGILTEASIGL